MEGGGQDRSAVDSMDTRDPLINTGYTLTDSYSHNCELTCFLNKICTFWCRSHSPLALEGAELIIWEEVERMELRLEEEGLGWKIIYLFIHISSKHTKPACVCVCVFIPPTSM